MRLLERAKLPLHDFPRYDRIILDSLHFNSLDVAAEIGVGTGATAFEVSPQVKNLVGIDISSELISVLRKSCPFDNLSFVEGDACDQELAERYCSALTKIYSCETLEHVNDPNGFFHTVSEMLQPEGLAAVLFPVWKGHGRIHFRSKEEIEDVLQANFLEPLEIAAIEFKVLPNLFRWVTVELPLNALRMIRTHFFKKGSLGQDKFHEYSSFEMIKKGRKHWHALVNFYWGFVVFIEQALFSPIYTKREIKSTVGRRILVLARRSVSTKDR